MDSFNDNDLLNDLENMGYSSPHKYAAEKPIRSNSFSNNHTNSFVYQNKENTQENQAKLPSHVSEFDLTPKNRGKRPPKIPKTAPKQKQQQNQNQSQMGQKKFPQPNNTKNLNKAKNIGRPPPIPKTQPHLSPKKPTEPIRQKAITNPYYQDEDSYASAKPYKKPNYKEYSFTNIAPSPKRASNRPRNKTPKPMNYHDQDLFMERPQNRRKTPTTRSKSVYSLEKQSYDQDERRIIAKKLRNTEKNVAAYLDMKLNIVKQEFLHIIEQKLETNTIIDDMVDIFCDEIKSQIEEEMSYYSLDSKTKKKTTHRKIVDLETILLPYDNQFIALFNKTAQVTHIKKLFDENKNILKTKSLLVSYKETIPSIFDQHIKDFKSILEEKAIAKEHSIETEEQSQLKYRVRRLKLKNVFWQSYLDAKDRECEFYENRLKHYNEESVDQSEAKSNIIDIHEYDFNNDIRNLIDQMNESLEREIEKRSLSRQLDNITKYNDEYLETSLKLSNIHNIIYHQLNSNTPNEDENQIENSKIAAIVQEKLDNMQNQRKAKLEQVTTLLDTIKPYDISTMISSEDEST